MFIHENIQPGLAANQLPGFYMIVPFYDSSMMISIIVYGMGILLINPLSANPQEWSNTLKQFVGNLPTICLSVFDHFMNLALKGLE